MFDYVSDGTSEVLRKMTLISERYHASPAVSHLPLAIRRAHRTLFGLSVVSGEGAFHHSLERSRTGLIVIEKSLAFLNFPIQAEKLCEVLCLKGGETGITWADAAAAEWTCPGKVESTN